MSVAGAILSRTNRQHPRKRFDVSMQTNYVSGIRMFAFSKNGFCDRRSFASSSAQSSVLNIQQNMGGSGLKTRQAEISSDEPRKPTSPDLGKTLAGSRSSSARNMSAFASTTISNLIIMFAMSVRTFKMGCRSNHEDAKGVSSTEIIDSRTSANLDGLFVMILMKLQT